VSVDNGLSLLKLRPVFARDLSGGLSLPTTRHALEATASRQHAPEAVFQSQFFLHNELT